MHAADEQLAIKRGVRDDHTAMLRARTRVWRHTRARSSVLCGDYSPAVWRLEQVLSNVSETAGLQTMRMDGCNARDM